MVDLRQRSARAHQCRHPPAACAADGQRPAQDRADELAAAVVPGHADHLLRRRDRHGRQHLSRRPQRRAHADAVEPGPQRRLLTRRSGPALRAADHGPRLWLRVGQRRGAVAQPVVAAQRHQAADLGAQVDARLRPRQHDVHPPGQPRRARLCPAVSRRGDPLRRQSVARGTGDRARPVAVEGPHPAGDARPHPLSRDRRTALHDHAGALRLLLVPAVGARQVRAGDAERGARVRDAGGAGQFDLGVARARARRVRA